MHKNDKSIKKKHRTRRRTKDLDQVCRDLRPENAAKLLNANPDGDEGDPDDLSLSRQDLPGQGRHYCIHCAYVQQSYVHVVWEKFNPSNTVLHEECVM